MHTSTLNNAPFYSNGASARFSETTNDTGNRLPYRAHGRTALAGWLPLLAVWVCFDWAYRAFTLLVRQRPENSNGVVALELLS